MTKPTTDKPTARSVALAILGQSRAREGFASELIDQHLQSTSLSGPDRGLVTQLVFGVLRRRGSLDALLKPFINRPVEKVEARVWDVLHLGAYQLCFLTHVPPHAAVFESVELVGMFNPGAKGFVNGILRRVSELVTPEHPDAPSSDALPLEGWKYRKLARAVLPDPATDPVGYLEAGFSWPRWLAERWLPRYGWEECVRLGFWFAGPAPLWLRVNRLRTDRESYLRRLAEAGVGAEPGAYPQALRLKGPHSIRDLPGYAEGDFSVQDETSMRVGSAVAPEPGWRVLDLCSAPGGKTTHLAELMDNHGEIVACDIDERRLGTLTNLCQRLGVSIVETAVLRPDGEAPSGPPFDAALVDVPCSNTGVLGRRPEVRWRLTPTDLRHLVPLQTRLLLQAAGRVRPGGVVVYSTCSIEPEENGAVVRAALQGLRDFELEAEEESRPGEPSDGGYWARLRRRG